MRHAARIECGPSIILYHLVINSTTVSNNDVKLVPTRTRCCASMRSGLWGHTARARHAARTCRYREEWRSSRAWHAARAWHVARTFNGRECGLSLFICSTVSNNDPRLFIMVKLVSALSCCYASKRSGLGGGRRAPGLRRVCVMIGMDAPRRVHQENILVQHLLAGSAGGTRTTTILK